MRCIILAMFIVALFMQCSSESNVLEEPSKEQDSLKNLPDYNLPLSNEKLVIAHCMTNIIRFQGHEFEDSSNPKYYPREGNITSSLGGMVQVFPMADELLANASLEEAVEFEMRAAIRSGIDGFQFYYVLGLPEWDDIIKAYFKVADQKGINFKFTFCISHPNGGSETAKVAEFASRINDIIKEVGRNNSHWLRTPDGRLIVYQWLGEGLADIPLDKQGLSDAYYVARAYKRLADAVNEQFACVFSINDEISQVELESFLDYFPATWIWTMPYSGQDYLGYRVAETCKNRTRIFTGSVFCDFYTSKLLKRGTWDMYHFAEDAVAAGISGVDRKYIACNLSYNFRKMCEFNIEQNVSILNVITWNDYPEGHHLAPEINHNDGFSILLNYYKNRWKGLPSPYQGRDVAIVFFKKYRNDIIPNPYNIPVVSFQREVNPPASEDSIEIVSLLRKKGTVRVNGHSVDVEGGLSVNRFEMNNGPVSVSVARNDENTIQFITPEGITSNPYRADRITYSFSSEFDRFYGDLFDGFKPTYSYEYNPGFETP